MVRKYIKMLMMGLQLTLIFLYISFFKISTMYVNSIMIIDIIYIK